MHARIVDGELEIKCGRRACGHAPGIVVLHRFSTTTGDLLRTLQYKTPNGRNSP